MKTRKPPATFQPITRRQELEERITVLEKELRQLQERGAPESEIQNQQGRIAQETLSLELLKD